MITLDNIFAPLSLTFFQITSQMTADALTKNIQECVKYGMDDLITKPVNVGMLEELLNQYLFRLDNQM